MSLRECRTKGTLRVDGMVINTDSLGLGCRVRGHGVTTTRDGVNSIKHYFLYIVEEVAADLVGACVTSDPEVVTALEAMAQDETNSRTSRITNPGDNTSPRDSI